MDLNIDFTEKRVIITAFFCIAFLIANLITVKIINIGFWGLEVPAGVLIYPLVYILTNVITEVYGENTARRALILAVLTNLLFVIMTTLILILPSPANYPGDSSLEFVFTQTPRILISSYLSFLIGNLANARVTAIVNRDGNLAEAETGKNSLRIKNLGAIALGELIDNIIFIGLSFVGVYSNYEVFIMIVSHWVISLIWIAIAQPFTEKTVSWASKDDATTA